MQNFWAIGQSTWDWDKNENTPQKHRTTETQIQKHTISWFNLVLFFAMIDIFKNLPQDIVDIGIVPLFQKQLTVIAKERFNNNRIN